MFRNITKIAFILISMSILLVLFYSKISRWDKYYQEKLHQPPRQFVIDALNMIPKANELQTALDLGCGVGHETLVLLQHGYRVIAVDAQASAFMIMKCRSEFAPFLSSLTTIVSNFETLDFSQMPQMDVIIASYALPFVSPEHFDNTFKKLIDVLKPGGYFIGNFFDPDFGSFKQRDRKNMTFHKKVQVLELFKDFKMLIFKEVVSPNKGTEKSDHIYEIFAQRVREEK